MDGKKRTVFSYFTRTNVCITQTEHALQQYTTEENEYCGRTQRCVVGVFVCVNKTVKTGRSTCAPSISRLQIFNVQSYILSIEIFSCSSYSSISLRFCTKSVILGSINRNSKIGTKLKIRFNIIIILL